MKRHSPWVLCLTASLALFVNQVIADEKDDVAAVQAATEAFVKAFNAAKVDGVVASFLPKGELIDENGTCYQGKEELTNVFTKYFEKFPDAKLGIEIESIRIIGDNLAVEEGTRYLSCKEDGKAQVRYVTFRTKGKDGWQIASLREFYDDPAPEPKENLASLGWMVGDWVSESPELAVKLTYRWSEDKNFLLGDFLATKEGIVIMKSSQRIGWDPLASKPRSWLFDADGGYAEGSWTQVGEGWLIKSQATSPEGTVGSATITIVPDGKDRFTMRGTDRIIGQDLEEDFDLTVTRRPPGAKEKPASTTTGATSTTPAVPATGARETKPAAATSPGVLPRVPSPASPKR